MAHNSTRGRARRRQARGGGAGRIVTAARRLAAALALPVLAGAVALSSLPVRAADAPAVVSHVKVLTNRVEDVSSLDAWKKSFIKDGMSDREKAMAVWRTVVAFRHQEAPPNEFVESEGNVHDPIKCFNVYGYGMCCCASANVEALGRHAGLEARGWAIIAHSVPELKWDGRWHMLDGSLITYFPKADGDLAGVEELTTGVSEWYAKNPQYKGNDGALRKFMGRGGWKSGPEVLSRCPSYDDNGWLPAATHGWYATMGEYANPGKTHLYEYGTAVGYEVNVQLRRGERLVRNWSNKGLHVNAAEGGKLSVLNKAPGKDDLRYTPKYGDIAPGRVGNGLLEYVVPVTDGALAKAALAYENLTATPQGLIARDASKPAELVLRMPTSYVYLSGTADLRLAIAQGGGVAVQLSDNNGLDWKDVANLTAAGQQTVDLKPLVYRKYDYRLKLTLKGDGTRVEALRLSHDVQHSQRVLPALAQGKTTITFEAGAQEGTITVMGSTNPKNKGKNLMLADFHPAANGFRDDMMFLKGAKGDLTLPVATPGPIKRLRVSAHYRARDKKDGFDVEASFDGGKEWKGVGRLEGPFAGNSKSFVYTDVPAGSMSALVRLSGKQYNTTGFHDLRIDADYAEPAGGVAPVKVTYAWEESGAEKSATHVTGSANDTWTIDCAAKPVMKSLTVERAD